jgi:tight adherence protein B
MQTLSELWVIYALVFGAALFGIQAGYWFIFRARKTQQTINRRLALSAEGASATTVLETLRSERRFTNLESPFLRRVSEFWMQTGLRFDANTLILASIALVAFFFIIFGLSLGFGLLTFVLAPLAAAVTVLLFLMRARGRRIAHFSAQLPDAVDVIVRGVRVGYPFSSAIALVAKEMPDPIGTEFGMTADEIAFGLDVRTALENLYRRVGQEDLLFLIIAMSIQLQTGGKLSDLLSRLAKTLRQRATLRLKVRALTAEGRLSGIFLSLTPFVLIGIVHLMSPSYFTSVLDNPIITPAIAGGLTLLFIGNVMMYRMINFKY